MALGGTVTGDALIDPVVPTCRTTDLSFRYLLWPSRYVRWRLTILADSLGQGRTAVLYQMFTIILAPSQQRWSGSNALEVLCKVSYLLVHRRAALSMLVLPPISKVSSQFRL